MKKVMDFLFKTTKAGFFLVTAILTFVGLWYANAYRDPEGFKWHDVIVELYGTLFDLLVFGFVLSFYEWFRERKDRIDQDKNLIEDLRGWKNEEGVRRTIGAVKRLKKNGATNIDLSRCFLFEARLGETILTNVDLSHTDLTEADLSHTDLTNANLTNANLTYANLTASNLTQANLTNANLTQANFSAAEERASLSKSLSKTKTLVIRKIIKDQLLWWEENGRANLSKANLMKANLSMADLSMADLSMANFTRANLLGVTLTRADLSGADLKEAIVSENWFEKLEEWKVTGREEIIAKYQIAENGILLLK